MKLSQWAKKQGVHYQTAWRWFKEGKMPVRTEQMSTGTVVVYEKEFLMTYSLPKYFKAKQKTEVRTFRPTTNAHTIITQTSYRSIQEIKQPGYYDITFDQCGTKTLEIDRYGWLVETYPWLPGSEPYRLFPVENARSQEEFDLYYEAITREEWLEELGNHADMDGPSWSAEKKSGQS